MMVGKIFFLVEKVNSIVYVKPIQQLLFLLDGSRNGIGIGGLGRSDFRIPSGIAFRLFFMQISLNLVAFCFPFAFATMGEGFRHVVSRSNARHDVKKIENSSDTKAQGAVSKISN